MPTSAPKYRARERVETRLPSHKRGYGWDWRRARKLHQAMKPLCEDCLAEGKVSASEEFHHVIKKQDGGGDNAENIMGLCKRHHSIRTARGE